MTPHLRPLQERLGVHFADPSLLATALTHPSWSEEHQADASYERLEFLGDSVLGFIVATHLFRAFPDRQEGDLTRMKWGLVSGTSLAEVGRDLGLDAEIRQGKGTTRDGVRDSVVEACFEAVVGAVFLDGGLDAAAGFVVRTLGDRIDPARLAAMKADPKSELQEITQARGLGLPCYRIVSSEGPAHEPRFTAQVSLGDEVLAEGSGSSKQAAERAAATGALDALR